MENEAAKGCGTSILLTVLSIIAILMLFAIGNVVAPLDKLDPNPATYQQAPPPPNN
jgi:hypothetical protein